MWSHAGKHDEVTAKHLANYLQGGFKAPSNNPKKKNNGPWRWKTTSAAVSVAALILRHGAELDTVLANDWPRECLPKADERLEALQKRNVQLEEQVAAAEKEAQRALKCERTAVQRNAEHVKDKTKLRIEERSKAANKAAKQAAGLKKAAAAKLCKASAVAKRRLKSASVKSVRDARKCWGKQSKEESKAWLARIEQARIRQASALQEQAEAAVQVDVAKLKRWLAAARKRARDKADAACLSGKRLKRAKVAETALKELQATLEKEPGEEESEDEALDTAPVGKSRRDARGRFGTMPHNVRVLVWAQLSRRVPPSAVAANISDAIGALAPAEEVSMPCWQQIHKMRGELTIASEAIAAFRIALSKRIISFGWDESTKFGLGLLSSNTQIETQDGQMVDVVMRGATLTAGGTAEAVAWSIDKKLFAHARRLLTEWKEAHEGKYGEGSWALAGGPTPESIGMHRLCEDTLLLTDTCNSARAAKRLVAEAAMAAGKEQVGEAAWEAMTQVERDASCKVPHPIPSHPNTSHLITSALDPTSASP